MKTNTAGHPDKQRMCAESEKKTKLRWTLFVVVLISVAFGAGGCGDYYAASAGPGPYYGGGPYYGRAPYYGGGPYYDRAAYGGYPGNVTVEVGDRPYYVRGPGYYVGRTYYVWRPGHWASRHGRRVWVHGHYVVR